MIGESEPGRLAFGVASGRMKNSSRSCKARFQQVEVAPARGDEIVEMIELRQADGGLHVGDLQIEAEMRVDVLVVVAVGQIAELPVEAAACRCCPCRARSSSRGPSRGTTPSPVASIGLLVKTAPPSPMVM